MYKIFFPLLLSVCCLQAFSQEKKYGIRSGKLVVDIHSWTEAMETKTVKVLPTSLKAKDVIWFSEFGGKEKRDYYEEGKIYESYIFDGKKYYHVRHRDKEYQEIEASEADLGKMYHADSLAGVHPFIRSTEKIAGKDCEVITINEDQRKLKLGGWNRLLFLYEMKENRTNTIVSNFVKKASSLEQIEIPDSEFMPPPSL